MLVSLKADVLQFYQLTSQYIYVVGDVNFKLSEQSGMPIILVSSKLSEVKYKVTQEEAQPN